MGFGDYPAGESPFGHDPVAAPPGKRRAMPRAARFDAATRSFLYEDDGQLADVHPIDQIVGLALVVVQGSIKGDPSLGSAFRGMYPTGGEQLQRAVQREVERVLAPQIAAGDVTLVSVVGKAGGRLRGRLSVTVQYRNNREPGVTVRTLTVDG